MYFLLSNSFPTLVANSPSVYTNSSILFLFCTYRMHFIILPKKRSPKNSHTKIRSQIGRWQINTIPQSSSRNGLFFDWNSCSNQILKPILLKASLKKVEDVRPEEFKEQNWLISGKYQTILIFTQFQHLVKMVEAPLYGYEYEASKKGEVFCPSQLSLFINSSPFITRLQSFVASTLPPISSSQRLILR